MAARCAAFLYEQSTALQQCLARGPAGSAEPSAKRERAFEVQLEAKLGVRAVDEASARCIVEKTLAPGRVLGPAVWATGQVYVYDAEAMEEGRQ